MPSLPKHLRAERRLLGTSTPEVHQVLDRFLHDHHHRGEPRNLARTVALFGQLLGLRAERVAILHMFQDWGIIREKDWKAGKCKASWVPDGGEGKA